MDFYHVIVIRFNLPRLFGGRHAGVVRDRPDEEWLRHRQELFESYTLPSLSNQSEERFDACVLYDEQSPPWLKQRNEQLRHELRFFYPMYVESHDAGIRAVKNHLDTRSHAEIFTHVVITRLDNDDALHRNAVAAIHRAFAHQEFAILNFYGILTFRPGSDEMLTYYRYPGGPFLSEIARFSADYRISLYSEHHAKWVTKTEVTQLGPFPYALQVLHERNVRNHERGKSICSIVTRDYGFEYQFRRPCWVRFLVHARRRIVPSVLRYSKRMSRRIMRRFQRWV